VDIGTKNKALTGLYIIVAVAVLATTHVKWDFPMLYGSLKGLLMPVLLVIAWQNLRGTKIVAPVLLAITCSWFGDVLLLFDDQKLFFMLGIGAFLLAQVAYIIAYFKATDTNFEPLIIRKYPLIPVGLALLPALILRVVAPYAGDLLVPVVIYSGALLIMVTAAVARYAKTSLPSFLHVTLGAFLFMLSDTLIAFDRFLNNVPLSGMFIMSTYMAAQWLILNGLIRHYKK
jgi:uncharacterized membrane protein YhhN